MAVDYPKTRMDNFYAKAAGSDMADTSMKPITDREYWINELAARLAEGGLVPPIEAGDDGKVLTASDGEAAWASAGGGSSDVVVVTVDDGALTASWNELLGYFNAHKIVLFPYYFEDDGEAFACYSYLTVLKLDPGTARYYAYFSTIDILDGEIEPVINAFVAIDPDVNMERD